MHVFIYQQMRSGVGLMMTDIIAPYRLQCWSSCLERQIINWFIKSSNEEVSPRGPPIRSQGIREYK